MKKNYLENLKKYIVVFVMLIVALLGIVITPVDYYAYATDINDLDKTNPLTDLMQDTSFDVNNYPFDKKGEVALYSFMEYCYAYDMADNGNYGLYVYIYNPQGLTFKNSTLNKIQLSVGYDGEGLANDYEKFRLQLCSFSYGEHLKKFYKFKVIDHKLADGTYMYDRLNKENRRYDVSGVELITEEGVSAGNLNAKDYTVAKTFYYTGYSKGYGPDKNEESTLKCSYDELETISLDLEHTFWRSQSSSKGAGYQNQIDTVYFSVPNQFFEKYGTLQRIKAEWYEYKTKDIIVTCSENFYNAAKDYVGVPTGEAKYIFNTTFSCYEGVSEIGHTLTQDYKHYNETYETATWLWNEIIPTTTFIDVEEAKQTIYYLFPTDNLGAGNSIGAYDPYNVKTNTAGVSSNALYDYILSYKKTSESGFLKVKDGTISADLFESDIDESRKKIARDANGKVIGQVQQGYSFYDFDVDVDLISFKSWQDTNPGFKENLKEYGFWNALFSKNNIPSETGTGDTPISPIITLNEEQLSGTDEEISKRLYVNISDVPTLKEYYTAQSTGGNTVVLFRYALSDYYSHPLQLWYDTGFLGTWTATENEVYRAKQSVFFDFDIIQLTFKGEGNLLTVIPVVASPIDIVNPVTQPTFTLTSGIGKSILTTIIIIIIVIILLFLISIWFPGIWKCVGAFFKYIGIGVWYVIKYGALAIFWVIWGPIKLIINLFKKNDGSDKPKKENKDEQSNVRKKASANSSSKRTSARNRNVCSKGTVHDKKRNKRRR